ncbi:MAG: hypothetical protein HYR74_10580 [Candidatus Eisenbacteria bacterium]|nr:hypothetical protein [Candidatus Eisenbacteria bacterium]
MSRVLVHEPRPLPTPCTALLADLGHDIVLCRNREAVLEAMAAGRPDVVVYVLHDLVVDLGVLSLVRRIAPTLPIILLGGPAGLAERRSVQELKPTYYGVFPLEPAELRDAVRGALDHHGRALAS